MPSISPVFSLVRGLPGRAEIQSPRAYLDPSDRCAAGQTGLSSACENSEAVVPSTQHVVLHCGNVLRRVSYASSLVGPLRNDESLSGEAVAGLHGKLAGFFGRMQTRGEQDLGAQIVPDSGQEALIELEAAQGAVAEAVFV